MVIPLDEAAGVIDDEDEGRERDEEPPLLADGLTDDDRIRLDEDDAGVAPLDAGRDVETPEDASLKLAPLADTLPDVGTDPLDEADFEAEMAALLDTLLDKDTEIDPLDDTSLRTLALPLTLELELDDARLEDIADMEEEDGRALELEFCDCELELLREDADDDDDDDDRGLEVEPDAALDADDRELEAMELDETLKAELMLEVGAAPGPGILVEFVVVDLAIDELEPEAMELELLALLEC
jgi:hypothetical protein